MKKSIIFFAMMLPVICSAQPKEPWNIYFTAEEVKGFADPNSVVKIDRNVPAGALPIISVSVDKSGYFEYRFETVLALIAGAQPSVKIWAESGGKSSAVKTYTAQTAADIIQSIATSKLVIPKAGLSPNNPEISGAQPTSTTFRYKVTMLNTNFTIPLARFNFVKGSTDKKGDILLFNSVGAGIGISWGEIEKTTDATGTPINTDFTNTFGIHLGVLFSSGKDGDEQKNIFAPTLSMSILDFQLGVGYEMGSRAGDQKKGFLTLAYAIPLSKLIKGKYYIFSSTKGYNATNPLLPAPKDSPVKSSSKRMSVNKFI